MKAGRLFRVAPVVLLLASPQLFAQSIVDERVQKLEEAVRVLESRVASLENQLRGPNPPNLVAPDAANWRKLRRGMSEGDVEQLLGSPLKVDANFAQTTWYYPGGGAVKFDARSKLRVEGWSEP